MAKTLKLKPRSSSELDALFSSPEKGRQLLLKRLGKGGERELVAANLFDLRLKAKLSQRELAEKANVGFRTLQRVEVDPNYSPSLDVLVRLGAALKVPAERFLKKVDLRKLYHL
jgi:DNA-binding XRE family transcriptional regulator